jgi:hypothetical protein
MSRKIKSLYETHGDFVFSYLNVNENESKILIRNLKQKLKDSVHLENKNLRMISINPIKGFY